MDEKPDQRFPWSILFLITGLCLLAFSYFMSILDGRPIGVFIKLGPLFIILSVIAFLNSWLSKKFIPHKKFKKAEDASQAF